MDFLSGLLGGLGGLSGLANAYQSSPEDNWLKKLLSSSSAGTGQTMGDENLLRNYFNYAPTSTDPATLASPKTGISTADENLLRGYFGYNLAQPQGESSALSKMFQGLGGMGGGKASQSSDASSQDSQKLSTGGGTGQNSKRDYSGLLSGLWHSAATPMSITGAIGIDPNTGLVTFGK